MLMGILLCNQEILKQVQDDIGAAFYMGGDFLHRMGFLHGGGLGIKIRE
jgi:hypothetical protein